ncbi:MAG: HD domain-containing protein [Lachnospiraceae bacterium]|nr:HD domain-containing protein [Lachnospiraceae bacterium]
MTDLQKNEVMTGSRRRQLFLPMMMILIGLILNIGGTVVVQAKGLMLYLDCMGTVLVAFLGGYVPGIAVALFSTIINNFSDSVSIFYAPVSVLIAVVTVYASKKGYLRKLKYNILYIIVLAFVGGGIGGIITWELHLIDSSVYSTGMVSSLYRMGFDKFWSWFIVNFLFDLIDKTVTVVFVRILLYLIPKSLWPRFEFVGWKQEPIIIPKEKKSKEHTAAGMNLNTKLMTVLVVFSVTVATICMTVCLILFRNYSTEQHSYLAEGVAKMAVEIVDGDRVNEFIDRGESAEGYEETEKRLVNLYKNSRDVEYVYVYKIMSDGCHVVFDVDTDGLQGAAPGDVVPFDDSFMIYLPDLLSGKRIDPIVSKDTYGWLLTYYEPVYDSTGSCVCYAGVDIAMSGLRTYEKEFVFKAVTIFAAFLMLLFAVASWFARFHLVLPINAMSYAADRFEYEDEYARKNNVEMLSKLDICTNDEIERLYRAFLKTTEESTRFFEENKDKMEKIETMQNSLILVLADMVENRDEGTGDHVRKTAAYVGITARKMKELGYYKDKMTDRFIKDCIRSAPLHDIGKISVSDVILNKPARLNDMEFELMKEHTTAGKEVIEKVIATMPDADYMEEAKNVAGYHHEKWDGSGYPEGLAGEEIPLSARIMAVADVFDALVSKRCYKDSFSYEKAMSIIKEEAGTHFDPLVADAFLKSEKEVVEVADRFAAREGKKERGGLT